MLSGIRFPNLGINIPPFGTGINVFGLEIRYYGIIIALGFFAGLLIACKEAKRTGQDPEIYLDYLLCVFIPAIICARLYYVIFSWSDYADNPMEIFAFRSGGLAIYGGVIGAVIVLYIFCKVRKQSFLLMGDTAVMGLLVGQIMGRWGNFFNREAFGGFTDNLFAMQIPVADAYYVTPDLLNQVVDVNGIAHLQVHPTFLYESLWNLAVLLLIFLYRKHKKFDGELVCLYLAGYGAGRFWIEGLRTDQLLIGQTGMAISQVLAGILVIFGIGLILFNRFNFKKSETDNIM